MRMSLIAGTRLEPIEPFLERLDFATDDALGLFGFTFAIANRFLHHGAQVVDVVQVNVLHRVEPLVEIARHAQIDQ